MLATKETVHIADLAAESVYTEEHDPIIVAGVELGGIRTLLLVPMLKENQPIGVFSLYRQEVRPFTDKQIELVKNFAAQAVIAIENARLLNELRQSLEEQTATSEVLQVISSSLGDLEPVFAAMLEKAVRICDAKFGNIYRWDGEMLVLVATQNTPPQFEELRRSRLLRHTPNDPIGRMIGTQSFVHTDDLSDEPEYIERSNPALIAAVEVGFVRMSLQVPILKEDELIGALSLSRQEVRPFTDKQIELVKNFAAQAVIAIENARLLTETREALEQQTATAEVLQVINSTPGDLAPVFDAMLEKAMRLCDASMGVFTSFDGNRFKPATSRGVPPRYSEYLATTSDQPSPDGTNQRVLGGGNVAHVTDLTEAVGYRTGHPWVRALVELGDARTLVTVALRKDDALLGTITLYRREVRSFSDKECALFQNFAAQAVIAMENARLLNELRESLQEQTATSEVLQVISSSPGDVHAIRDTSTKPSLGYHRS
jgi:GAF domain-containing protein